MQVGNLYVIHIFGRIIARALYLCFCTATGSMAQGPQCIVFWVLGIRYVPSFLLNLEQFCAVMRYTRICIVLLLAHNALGIDCCPEICLGTVSRSLN